jgi:hypothetical protein
MAGQRSDGENPYCAPMGGLLPDLVSSYPTHAEVEPGLSIDAPALAPALNAAGLTRKAPVTAQIHTGSWFNHDPE